MNRNPFDGPRPRTVYEEMLGPKRARLAAMEADLAHFRAMAALVATDPAAAAERALWLQLADEMETYLRPPAVGLSAPLFDLEPRPPPGVAPWP